MNFLPSTYLVMGVIVAHEPEISDTEKSSQNKTIKQDKPFLSIQRTRKMKISQDKMLLATQV